MQLSPLKDISDALRQQVCRVYISMRARSCQTYTVRPLFKKSTVHKTAIYSRAYYLSLLFTVSYQANFLIQVSMRCIIFKDTTFKLHRIDNIKYINKNKKKSWFVSSTNIKTAALV